MRNSHNNGHQRCPECNSTQTAYYGYRDTTQSDVYYCIVGCGEFPVPTLEIPDAQDYLDRFYEKYKDLSEGAYEMAVEYIKPIEDALTLQCILQTVRRTSI